MGNRKNAAVLLEGGAAAVGAPINLPIGDRGGQIIIVSQTNRNKRNSSIDFSFKINGMAKPWWDTMGDVYFWLAWTGVIIILISIVTGCYGGFCCCLCRPCRKEKSR